MVPVAVSRSPAAATRGDALRPEDEQRSTGACAGPMGSWLSRTTPMSTAMASKTDASTPTAFSISQLRAIWATTATSTNATSRALASVPRRTARPRRIPRPVGRPAAARPPAMATVTATQTIGVHHGRPSGPTSVKENSPASTPSTAMMGTSAASSGPTEGVSSGDERRSSVMRAAAPTCGLTTLAAQPRPEARKTWRRSTLPPAPWMQPSHASPRATSATICSAIVSSGARSTVVRRRPTARPSARRGPGEQAAPAPIRGCRA